MPEILPFRGILYDTEKVPASDVLAPPYDVIDADGRAALAAKHDRNCVGLILPEGEGEAKYAAAAETLNAWLTDGTLLRDDRPAVYRYHQVFDIGTRSITRRGFVAAVKLHAFDEGIILPHERTLKGPKIDRLNLMSATGAHLSQIFGMYADPAGETDRAFRPAENDEPYIDAVTDDGTRHRVWRVYDREIIGKVTRVLSHVNLYIADGHHRYETMLALRDKLGGLDLSPHSQAQYATMFLANMSDAGLVVLPIHRMIHSVKGFKAEDLLAKAGEFFDTSTIENGANDQTLLLDTVANSSHQRPSFAALFPGKADATLFTLRSSVRPERVGITGHRSIQKLDVTLLHSLVLERLLGIDAAALEAQTNVRYLKSTEAAVARNAAGEGQVTFIMEPTHLKQVKDVADAHEFMPQKSTFFYPKIASGIVFNRIDPDQDLY
jgi:uncharacterized protein (DUF1015 family)